MWTWRSRPPGTTRCPCWPHCPASGAQRLTPATAGKTSEPRAWRCATTRLTARHASGNSGSGRLLVHRRPVDLLDRGLELGVELIVGLACRQPFEKRAREAGDEGGIAC